MTGGDGPERRLVVVSAGTGDPSSTRMLADAIARACLERLAAQGVPTSVEVVEVVPLAVDVARAAGSGLRSDAIVEAVGHLTTADAVLACSPVYKAGMSGLFKSFFDLLDDDVLIAKPVLLAATAGSPRHALVVDEQMRPLFAYMRALTVPTSVFAAPQDWAEADLGGRIRRAAVELTVLMAAEAQERIADGAWSEYEHHFAGDASRGQQTAGDLDFDAPLMRLAAGGRQPVDAGP